MHSTATQRRGSTFRRFGLVWRALVLVVVVAGCVFPGVPAHAVSAFDATSSRVDVGGYKLYMECVGTGSPTVVMSGSFVERWDKVQPAVAQYTRTCAYDQAGMGMSDAGRIPTTVEHRAMELRRLVEHAKISPPYILVGEGLNGSAMQMYAGLYAHSTAGLVLVDSIPAHYFRKADALLFGLQQIDLSASRRELHAVRNLGGVPLVVVSHGVYLSFPHAIEKSWRKYEEGLSRLSSNSVYAIARRSGYGIPQTQPEVVIEAIDQILLARRTHQRLLNCGSWLPSAGAICPVR